MSVNIVYKPVKPEKYTSFEGGVSSDLRILEEEFGNPIIIKDTDAKILKAMGRAANKSFYEEVAHAAEKYGTIKVWGEY